MIRSIVTGTGSYLPEKVITNDDLAKIVETSDEWIYQRTGIKKRHFAAEDQWTADLATEAAKKALAAASVKADDIDVIVVATATPDEVFPAVGTQVQARLGMKSGLGFDVAGVCAGFLLALQTADNMIKTGQVKRALVIGAEVFSRIIDMKDRTTCVLFGDGAGAVVLEADSGEDNRGVMGVHLHSDGALRDILYADGGVSSTQSSGLIRMKGQDVFKNAVSKLANSAEETLAKHNISPDELDWLIPHQANVRIIDGMAKKLKMDASKVIKCVDQHANTSAASIPLALDWAVNQGKIKRGDLIIHDAIGGGMIWGSALVRW